MHLNFGADLAKQLGPAHNMLQTSTNIALERAAWSCGFIPRAMPYAANTASFSKNWGRRRDGDAIYWHRLLEEILR